MQRSEPAGPGDRDDRSNQGNQHDADDRLVNEQNEADGAVHVESGDADPGFSDQRTEPIRRDDRTGDDAAQRAPRRVTLRQEPEGATGHPSTSVQRQSDWFWPVVNLVGVLVVVIVNGLANWIPFNGQTTGAVVDQDPVYFQPAGWVFTIWGLIYLLLVIFAIYGLLPPGRRNTRIRRISPIFLITNIANCVWLVFWHWEQFEITMVVISILLLSLIAIYVLLHFRTGDVRRPRLIHRLIVWTPFSIYLGWISIATIANAFVLLDRQGWDGGTFSPQVWTAIMIGVGALVAALIAFFRHDALYPLVFVWAYIGIAARQWGDGSTLVSVTAIVFAVICAALTFMAFLLSFDNRAMSGIYSRTHRKDPLPLE